MECLSSQMSKTVYDIYSLIYNIYSLIYHIYSLTYDIHSLIYDIYRFIYNIYLLLFSVSQVPETYMNIQFVPFSFVIPCHLWRAHCE